MAKRAIKMGVCSGCYSEFPYKELYWVERWMHESKHDSGKYSYPLCKGCLEPMKEHYLAITEEPKQKKQKTAK